MSSRTVLEVTSITDVAAPRRDRYLFSRDGQPYTHRYRGLPIVYVPGALGVNRRMAHLFTRAGEYAETYNSLAKLKDIVDADLEGFEADAIPNRTYRITRV